jgi:hypothetical protein
MNRALERSRSFARAIIATTFVFALAPPLEATAQDAAPKAAPADAATTSAQQPQSRRERRRAAEVTQAQAVGAAAPTAAADPAAAAPADELVCKKIEVTGSKIGKRVCGTQAQWDARNRRTSGEAQDAVRSVGERSQFPAEPTVPTAATGVGLSL